MRARTQYLMAAGLVLGVLVAGWFIFIGPKVSATNEARGQTRTAVESAMALQVQLAMLRQEVPGLPAQQQRLRAFETRIPPTVALPELIRQLSAVAQSSQVEIVNLTPATPSTPTPSFAPAPSPSGSAGAPSPSSRPSPNVPPAAVTPGLAYPAVPATTPGTTPGPSGTVARYRIVPITMVVTGTYFLLENFLTAVETMQRAVVFTSVALAPADTTPSPTTGVTGPTTSPTTRPTTTPTTNPTTGASPSGSDPVLRAVLKGSAFTSTVSLPADSASPPPSVPNPPPSAVPTVPTTPGAPPSGAAALGPPGDTSPPAPTPSAGGSSAQRARRGR